jgi:hypothetical protein
VAGLEVPEPVVADALEVVVPTSSSIERTFRESWDGIDPRLPPS